MSADATTETTTFFPIQMSDAVLFHKFPRSLSNFLITWAI